MAFLEVKKIEKSFGKTDVLKGIDFTLEKGEVLAIIGSSGSGKTTLLRCLNYLEVPDSGEIWINGTADVADMNIASWRGCKTSNNFFHKKIIQQFLGKKKTEAVSVFLISEFL